MTTRRVAVPWTVRALAGAAFTAWLVACFSPPAMAHTEFVDSTPDEGAVVKELPEQLALTFSGEIAADFAVVTAGPVDGGGEATRLDVAVEGTRVLATVPAEIRAAPTPGAWTMSYRVTSADGHPIDGQVSFELRIPKSAVPSSEAADPTSTATQSPASDNTPSPDSPDGAATLPDSTSPSSDGDGSVLSVIVIGAVAVAGVAGGLYLLGWRRSSRTEA